MLGSCNGIFRPMMFIYVYDFNLLAEFSKVQDCKGWRTELSDQPKCFDRKDYWQISVGNKFPQKRSRNLNASCEGLKRYERITKDECSNFTGITAVLKE